MGGSLTGGVQFMEDIVGQACPTSDDSKSDIVLQKRLLLHRQHFDEESHQGIDLAGGSFPVLLTEGVQGQRSDPDSRTVFDDSSRRCHPGSMALEARLLALGRPATIAVHDDGDVRWYSLCGNTLDLLM